MEKTRVSATATDEHQTHTWFVGRSRPRVTIAVPLFNASRHVDNLLTQLDSTAFLDAELVVVLDGADHLTEERLLEHEFKWPAAVVTIPSHAGVAVAREVALKWSCGEFVWFVDADDAWPTSALADLVGAATDDVDVVVGQATRHVVKSAERLRVATPRAGQLDREQYARELLEGRVEGYLWNKLIRISTFPTAGAFAPLRTKSDFYGVVSTLPLIRRVRVIDSHVYEYLFSPGSISSASISTPLDVFRVYEYLVETLRSAAINYRKSELATFVVNTVARITVAETARYGEHAVNGPVALDYLRGLLRVRRLVELVLGGRFRLFFLALAIRLAPYAVSRAYKLRRSRRWLGVYAVASSVSPVVDKSGAELVASRFK